MFKGYKVKEFVNSDNYVFELKENNLYASIQQNIGTHSQIEMFENNMGSVKSSHFRIKSVLLDSGFVLNEGVDEIQSFTYDFDKKQVEYINKYGIKCEIITSNIETQQEIPFKLEPKELKIINGYTLEDIRIVLEPVLDLPELIQVLLDFKVYKRVTDIIDPVIDESIFDPIKMDKDINIPSEWYIVIRPENVELVKKWRNSDNYTYAFSGAYGKSKDMYYQYSCERDFLKSFPAAKKINANTLSKIMKQELRLQTITNF